MKINNIFESADGIFPKEALALCQDGKAYIAELDSVNSVRRFQIVAVPEPTFEEIKTVAISRIDNATSIAILDGFDYTINNKLLHFSYQLDDQLNFSDTANGALLSMQGVEGVPTTIEWNGWSNHTKNYKGDLVVLTLDAKAFIELYTKGALAHKATQIEIGRQRKAQINTCKTVEEINSFLAIWNI